MIIAISGKIESGKDTVGKIINYLTLQYLSDNPSYKFIDYCEDLDSNQEHIGKFEIKKFASKVKDIICLLINCTRGQLENIDFKNTELGEEWTKFYLSYYRLINEDNPEGRVSPYFDSYNETLEYKKEINYIKTIASSNVQEQRMTPRLLMQLIGTDCGRDVIHPNIWINALMGKYKPEDCSGMTKCSLAGKPEISCNKCPQYPNWIITDMRFPNELEAVKRKEGINIRINRIKIVTEKIGENVVTWFPIAGVDYIEHESESALDTATFDYSIDNDGTIEELIEKVKQILIKERII